MRTTVLVLLAAGAGLFLRVVPPHDGVLGGETVCFQGQDAWYHARAITYAVANWPQTIGHDPYALHPGGQRVPIAPGFDLLVATAAKIAGWGSPSPEHVSRIAAIAPALLGALVPIATFALGRLALSSGAGLVAAWVVALLPGPGLERSLLGFTDHHVGEMLFSTLFLVLFLGAAGRTAPRPVVLGAVFAGAALSMHLATWIAGFTLALFLAGVLVVHAALGSPRGATAARTPFLAGVIACVAGALFLAPLARAPLAPGAWIALTGSASVIALAGVAAGRGAGVRTGAAAIAALALVLLSRALSAPLAGDVAAMTSPEAAATIAEFGAMPYADGLRTFSWPFVLGQLGAVALLVRYARRRRLGDLLVVSLLVVALGATLRNVRSGYYLAVPLALATGALAPLLAAWFRAHVFRHRVVPACVGVGLALLAIAPGLPRARAQAEKTRGPSEEWRAALAWIQSSTPEPFENERTYVSAHSPDGGYGVLSLWDQGYWITALARRPPNANPSHAGAREAARALLAGEPAEIRARLEALGTRYVALDGTHPIQVRNGRFTGRLRGTIAWAGEPLDRYVETVYVSESGGRLSPRLLYHPQYYRTLAYRLWVGGGGPVTPSGSSTAVRLEPGRAPDGTPIRLVRARRGFETHEAAAAFLASSGGSGFVLVGESPFRTCVPLEALEGFRTAWASRLPPDDLRHVRVFSYGWEG